MLKNLKNECSHKYFKVDIKLSTFFFFYIKYVKSINFKCDNSKGYNAIYTPGSKKMGNLSRRCD